MNRATIKQIGKDNVRKQWGELLLALVLVEAATTVAALREDFNNLLAVLRRADILAAPPDEGGDG